MSDCVIVSHIILTLNQFYLRVHAIPTNTDLKGDSHVFCYTRSHSFPEVLF